MEVGNSPLRIEIPFYRTSALSMDLLQQEGHRCQQQQDDGEAPHLGIQYESVAVVAVFFVEEAAASQAAFSNENNKYCCGAGPKGEEEEGLAYGRSPSTWIELPTCLTKSSVCVVAIRCVREEWRKEE